jgi:hypothetical protein
MFPLKKSMGTIKNASAKLSAVKEDAGESVHQVEGHVKKKPWIFDNYQCLSVT